MIKLRGLLYGKHIKVECENEDICAVFQYRLNDILDIKERDKVGCPVDCKYIVRKSEDNPFFVCNVLVKGDIEYTEESKKSVSLCMCEKPIKEYSKTTCTCCWTCKKCGRFGGCDNMYWMTEEQIKEKLKDE